MKLKIQPKIEPDWFSFMNLKLVVLKYKVKKINEIWYPLKPQNSKSIQMKWPIDNTQVYVFLAQDLFVLWLFLRTENL